jgi:hypothetical protein
VHYIIAKNLRPNFTAVMEEETQDDCVFRRLGFQCLRYTDYISSREVIMPVLAELEKELGIPVHFVSAPPDASGPRIDQAVHAFSEDRADIGRI